MFKRIGYFCGALAIVGIISGCSGEKGSAFVGRWSSGNEDGVALSPPTYIIDIKKNDEIFHVDMEITSFDFMKGGRKKTLKKLEGKAESETVLSVTGAPISLNMRLEGGRMFFDGNEFIKSK